jgi:hypothetical protein
MHQTNYSGLSFFFLLFVHLLPIISLDNREITVLQLMYIIEDTTLYFPTHMATLPLQLLKWKLTQLTNSAFETW